MLENGADIRFIHKLLGHESLKSTQTYTEVNIKNYKKSTARLILVNKNSCRLAKIEEMNDNMSIMTMKEAALKTIEEMPETASWEEIEEKVRFVAALEKGLEQVDKGQVIPHEQVKKNLESWLTK